MLVREEPDRERGQEGFKEDEKGCGQIGREIQAGKREWERDRG